MTNSSQQETTSDFLVLVTLGGVQAFIGAARRSRDLWYGSYIFSEVIKAAARAVHEEGGILIFPALDSDDPGASALRPASPMQVSNRLLFRAPAAGHAPDELAGIARDAAQACWHDMADTVLKELKRRVGAGITVDEQSWSTQVQDSLVLSAAWEALPSEATYQTAMQNLYRRLAARRRVRDFPTNPLQHLDRDKSSLGGRRESVLALGPEGREKILSGRVRRALGLNETEVLDCPGWVKRLGGREEQFVALTRLAMDGWVRRQVAQGYGQWFRDLLDIHHKLRKHGLASYIDDERYQEFPFDGQLLYRWRFEAVYKQLRREGDEGEAIEHLAELRKKLDRTLWKLDAPPSYVAVLTADGDHMGRAITRSLTRIEDHQDLSRALSRFAEQARELFDQPECLGCCVYAGGDETLALLPLDKAIPAARALRRCFQEAMGELALQPQPTLSVGIGVGHMLEPMNLLIHRARRAQQLAKDDGGKSPRNALAILSRPRAGGEAATRLSWAMPKDPVARFQTWIEAFQAQQLPRRTPYLLRNMIGQIEHIPDSPRHRAWLIGDMHRVLVRREPGGEPGQLPVELQETLKTRFEEIFAVKDERHRRQDWFVNELIIARHIALGDEEQGEAR